MRPIDSLLGILVQQGGNELRLLADRRPQMFAGETELALTMPAMSAERIRQLLDDLWTANAAELGRRGRLALTYRSDELGVFAFHLTEGDGRGLEVELEDHYQEQGDRGTCDRVCCGGHGCMRADLWRHWKRSRRQGCGNGRLHFSCPGAGWFLSQVPRSEVRIQHYEHRGRKKWAEPD